MKGGAASVVKAFSFGEFAEGQGFFLDFPPFPLSESIKCHMKLCMIQRVRIALV